MRYRIGGIGVEAEPLTEAAQTRFLPFRDEAVSISVRIPSYREAAEVSERDAGTRECEYLYRALCFALPAQERAVIHGAAVSYRGVGYVFSAASGVGKSTHAGLWEKYVPACRILNGDKPIVAPRDGILYGSPFQGKENVGYAGEARLGGMCFLERAAQNRVYRPSQAETLSRLFRQIPLPPDAASVERLLALSDGLIKNVPFYVLQCNISREAVALSFEAMTGERLPEREEGDNQ